MEEIISRFIKVLVLVLCLIILSAKYVESATLERPKTRRLISISLPDKRPLKKALGFIEDTYLNFTELTTKYHFPTEEYEVTTEDGYVLKVFRILPKCNETKGHPVLLMHGLTDTADQWILTGPRTGLGYILANKCRDVWAANHRGNVYARKHVRLDPDKDPEFWDYSFDEHGYYDLPATIDFVLNRTGQTKVNYIGHSQGTTNFLVMGSLRPEYNDKIKISILLSPVAYMKYISSPVPKLIAPSGRQIRTLLEDVGLSEILGKRQIIHTIIEFLCQFAPEDICGTGWALGTGYKRGNIAPRTIAIAFGHLFAGLSTKDLAHFGQLIDSGKFQRYDEGRKVNLKRYSSPIPPEYNVTKVTSGVVLVCAKNDGLSSLEDIKTLRAKLPNVIEYYEVPDPTWSHNDQVFGINAPKYVFTKIFELLDEYDP